MTIPTWWGVLLLGLASWRTFHLLAHDDILDRPRRYVTALGDKWQKDGDPTPPEYRLALAKFISCPFCLGFWVAVVWWVFWLFFPTETLWVSVPFALSAILVAAQQYLSSE